MSTKKHEDFGRLAELHKAAEEMGLDVAIAYAVLPNSPMGTPPSFFLIAVDGALLSQPKNIGSVFDFAYDYLGAMKSEKDFITFERRQPYYGG